MMRSDTIDGLRIKLIINEAILLSKTLLKNERIIKNYSFFTKREICHMKASQ